MAGKLFRFMLSFKYAVRGIWYAVKNERNLRFHLCIAVYVYVFSVFYNFSKAEYILITIFICGVIALELVNSAIEATLDKTSPEKNKLAGAAKDMAAGGVFVFAIGAFVSGILLFLQPVVIQEIFEFFKTNILWLAVLIVSMIAAGWFIFAFNMEREK